MSPGNAASASRPAAQSRLATPASSPGRGHRATPVSSESRSTRGGLSTAPSPGPAQPNIYSTCLIERDLDPARCPPFPRLRHLAGPCSSPAPPSPQVRCAALPGRRHSPRSRTQSATFPPSLQCLLSLRRKEGDGRLSQELVGRTPLQPCVRGPHAALPTRSKVKSSFVRGPNAAWPIRMQGAVPTRRPRPARSLGEFHPSSGSPFAPSLERHTSDMWARDWLHPLPTVASVLRRVPGCISDHQYWLAWRRIVGFGASLGLH
jgi:hypothetical protein